jgi:hypothetical protein
MAISFVGDRGPQSTPPVMNIYQGLGIGLKLLLIPPVFVLADASACVDSQNCFDAVFSKNRVEGRGNCAQTAAFAVDDDWHARDKNGKNSAIETGCVT